MPSSSIGGHESASAFIAILKNEPRLTAQMIGRMTPSPARVEHNVDPSIFEEFEHHVFLCGSMTILSVTGIERTVARPLKLARLTSKAASLP